MNEPMDELKIELLEIITKAEYYQDKLEVVTGISEKETVEQFEVIYELIIRLAKEMQK